MHIPLYRTFFWSILDSRWYFLIIYRRQDVNSQDSNTKIVILFENYSGRQKNVGKFENNVLVNLIQPLCALGFPLSCAICSQKEVLKKLHVSTHLKRDKNLFNCLLQPDAGLLNTVNLLKKQKV